VSPVVFIIDDDPSMRDALQSLLLSVGHAVRAFASADDFMRYRTSSTAGCLVLDIRLPGRSGLEFQLDLQRSGMPLPVVFITGHGDIPMCATAMKAGAIEFLTKPFREQDLLDAVHRGLRLDRERQMASAALAEVRERYNALTPREREVTALIAAGWLNKQIAARLSLSEITIKVHRAQAMSKMQAGSLLDLVRMVDRLGLEDLDL
jgi:FixJ family two-component response regulator